jgi:hypothetical protein
MPPIQANRQTHEQGNNKNNEGKQRKNTNGKHALCDHVKKGSEPKKQRSRILKYMKINIYEESYTLEDGHVGRNM